MERQVTGVQYELVTETGERLGGLTSDQTKLEIGDLVPCGGHVFEIRTIEENTLHVRRVI